MDWMDALGSTAGICGEEAFEEEGECELLTGSDEGT